MKGRWSEKSEKEEKNVGLSLRSGVIIFVLISFLGWCFEKLGRYLLYNSVDDRGFLTLPLCPIYGVCILLIGLLLGSPSAPAGPTKPLFRIVGRLPRFLSLTLRFAVYFIAVTILSTAVELVVGLTFRAVGIPLWNYSERPGNLFGVICPGYSLLWGVLITLVMSLLWVPLCRLVGRIPQRVQGILAVTFSALILSDFLFNCAFIALTGQRFFFLAIPG